MKMERYYIQYYLIHPRETISLVRFWWRGGKKSVVKSLPENATKDWIWVYDKLMVTGRTFSALAAIIHDEIRDPLSLFYVILRALDSIGNWLFKNLKLLRN